jgi:hypothetical protein
MGLSSYSYCVRHSAYDGKGATPMKPARFAISLAAALCVLTLAWFAGLLIRDRMIPVRPREDPPNQAPPHPEISNIASELRQLAGDESLSCNLKLRKLQGMADGMRGDRPWPQVHTALKSQGMARSNSAESLPGFNNDYLIKKAVYMASKLHWDLHLALQANRTRIYDARVDLRARVDMPYADAARQTGHPKGSVLEFVIDQPDVRSQGAIWPVMKSIIVTYAPAVGYHNAPNLHPAFLVDFEFAASASYRIGGMRLHLEIESGLDPERSWDQVFSKSASKVPFEGRDTFGDVSAHVATEWWYGDGETQRANKAKYLRQSVDGPKLP